MASRSVNFSQDKLFTEFKIYPMSGRLVVPSDRFLDSDVSLLVESTRSLQAALEVVEQKAAEFYAKKHDAGRTVADEDKEVLAGKGLVIAHDMGYAAGFQEAERRFGRGAER